MSLPDQSVTNFGDHSPESWDDAKRIKKSLECLYCFESPSLENLTGHTDWCIMKHPVRQDGDVEDRIRQAALRDLTRLSQEIEKMMEKL